MARRLPTDYLYHYRQITSAGSIITTMKPYHRSIRALPPDPEPVPPAPPMTASRLRRLKWDEIATEGDFTTDGHEGYELWYGPAGFQSGSFITPIYRCDDQRSPKIDKSID